MCGISGVAVPLRRGSDVELDAVERMNASLTHRGPDDSGVFVDGNIALANRRLSIVDVPGGHQPMASADGTLIVTYNGEIYNAPELRRELETRGRRYRTNCDTEAVLHVYAEHGNDVVHRLRGCYAFALWDQRSRELTLVRDRFGVKPLYYVHAEDGTLAFASEIKALVAGGFVRSEPNYAALSGYLINRATYGEQTMFAGVRRLLPGHILVWRDGDVRTERYWDADATDAGASRLDHDYVEEWSALFRESVELRLMADVPIGVLLSGGIDSSAIAAVMTELTGAPIKTFSIGFPEEEANELAHARLVARHLGSDHRDVTVSAQDFFDALPELAWYADEPMGHPSSVPLALVSRLAAQDVKAVLCGEGGDETLAGYSRYRTTLHNLAVGRRYERVTTASLRRRIAGGIDALPRTSRHAQRLERTFLRRPADLRNLYFDNFSVFEGAALRRLMTEETAARVGECDPHAEAERFFAAPSHAGLLQRLLYADQKTYLPALLMRQDTMSMSASLESRVPFLDHELAALSAALPAELKLRRGWTTKYVLRRSMKGRLPDPILTRRKLGFPVPVDKWFRGAFRHVVDEYVLSGRARQRGLFEHASLERLVREHDAGARHGHRLWSLVALELWARCFLDGEEPGRSRPNLALVSGD